MSLFPFVPPKPLCGVARTLRFHAKTQKKTGTEYFCCRFHHSLPDSRGDQLGISVHRVNASRRLKRLDPVEHGRCQRARFRVIELLLVPCSFHGQVEQTTKTEFASSPATGVSCVV